MNCEEFELMLPELLEGELGGEGNSKVISHIKSCKKCNNMLQELISIRRELSGEFNYSNIEFNSRKKKIIDSIDENKYRKKPFNFKIKGVILSAMAATIAGIIIFKPYIKDYLKNNIEIELMNDIGKDKYLMRNSENIKGNIYTEMRQAVDKKLNTVGDVVMNDKDNIYRDLKENDGGLARIVNHGDFTVFTKGNYIFGYDKKSEKYYGVVDLSKIDKTNNDTLILATNDGRFVVFGKGDFTGQNNDSNIYIIDLITNDVKCIENENIWSWDIGIGSNSDSVVLLDKGRAIEFEDLKVSKEPKEYTDENIDKLLDRDMIMRPWDGGLNQLSKKVYGDKLVDGDQIIYYKNQRLYVIRKDEIVEISKSDSKIIKHTGRLSKSYEGWNFIGSNNGDLSIFNIDSKIKYNYEKTKDVRVSYNGDYIIDKEGKDNWITVKFPKNDNRSPIKIIENKYFDKKSLITTDSQNRLTVISGIDKDKVFDIKTINIK